MCGRLQGGYQCEHHASCVAARHPVTIRQGNQTVTGTMAKLSPYGVCIDLDQGMELKLGAWIVMRDAGAMRIGFDARVVGRDGRRYRIAFDPALVAMMSELDALGARGGSACPARAAAEAKVA